MKVRIYPVNQIIEVDVPEYVFSGYDEKHSQWMLDDYIRTVMMQPDWWHVDVSDKEEVRLAYKRRKKGVERIEGEMQRGNYNKSEDPYTDVGRYRG